jgi:hypothetical protein
MIPLFRQSDRQPARPAQIRPVLEAFHRRVGRLLRLCNGLLIAIIVAGMLFSLLINALIGHIPPDSPDTGRHRSASKSSDPNWDGLLTGAAWGMTLGQGIPLIGFIVGPVAGAGVGYDLDRRL